MRDSFKTKGRSEQPVVVQPEVRTAPSDFAGSPGIPEKVYSEDVEVIPPETSEEKTLEGKTGRIPKKSKRIELFADWYNLTHDRQKSAVMAGYSPSSAEKYSGKLIDKATVLGLIEHNLLAEAPRNLRRLKALAKGELVGAMEKTSGQIVLAATVDMLDRVAPKRQVIEQFTMHAELPPDRVEQLFSRLRGPVEAKPE